MQISLNSVGRRFNKEWIFSNITTEFIQGKSYALLGPNGSGKSTLLNVLSGNLSPSEGQLVYSHEGKDIPVEDIYGYISLAAPYLELIETFTLKELIEFHFKFKALHEGLNTKKIISLLGFDKATHKEIKHFSSGMKQRTKLALACCANTPILFLDEPTSNLDEQGNQWYLDLMSQFSKNKLVIIGSNQAHEYSFCDSVIKVSDYK